MFFTHFFSNSFTQRQFVFIHTIIHTTQDPHNNPHLNRTTMSGVEIPRNFILLDELEKGEKSQFCDPSLSWGLTDSEDVNLSDWNASILGPSGVCLPRPIKHHSHPNTDT